MKDPPKDTYPDAEKRIFQDDLETLKKEGTPEEVTQFWNDFKKYRQIKKTMGRAEALKDLPKESLLRKKFETVFSI